MFRSATATHAFQASTSWWWNAATTSWVSIYSTLSASRSLNYDQHGCTTVLAIQDSGQQSEEIISRYPNLMQPPATIKHFVHKPTIDRTIRPCSQPYRRVPIALEDPVKTELQRMEREGIIEKIDSSPWVSNMVVVRKPDGGVRICCDLSLVNKAVIADRYPLPTLEELTTDFAGARFFTKLDLKWGYLQVELHMSTRDITGMVTPLGLFRWTRMPFGLSSAPSAFQKIIAIIIKDCDGAKNLLDDIAVWGRTKAEHDDRLDHVLRRLHRYNVRLNPDKCLFGVQEMDFIGHHFSVGGVKPLQSNVEAILNMPQPSEQEEACQLSRFSRLLHEVCSGLRRYRSTTPSTHARRRGVGLDSRMHCGV